MKGIVWSAIAGLALVGCGGGGDPSGKEQETAVSVGVYEVRRVVVGNLYDATGTLRGLQTAVLTSKVPGYVEKVLVEAGARVRPGQPLVVLAARELEAGRRAAEAAVAEAEQAILEAEAGLEAAEAGWSVASATFERFQSLREQRAVTRQEFDEVEARYRAAAAEKEAAGARLRRARAAERRATAEADAARTLHDYTQVTAPFAGRVTQRQVDVGNLASPGTPLLVIEQEGRLRAEVHVEESQVGSIHEGDFADVLLEGLAHPLRGEVTEVEPAIDARARTFLVKVALPEDAPRDRLGSGHFVRVQFTVGQTERMLIPASAVFQKGQLEMVYVVEEGRARLRLVTMGRKRGQRVEVLSGLGEGDRVIREVTPELSDGTAVAVTS